MPYGVQSLLQCESSVVSLYEDLKAKDVYQPRNFLFMPGEFEIWTQFLGWEIKDLEMFDFIDFLA